jgi:glutamyl-tRNA reductase
MLIVRSPENVQISGVEVAPMSAATEALARWPAVVSASSAGGRLVPDDLVDQLISERSGPLTLVDLAMPPDFDPPATPGLTHFDIDNIARRSHRTIDTRAADDHIEAAAIETFRLVDSHHEVGPIIAQMMRTADEIVDRSVDRFAGRLGGPDDRSVLRQTAHTVARTLLAGPVSYLRSKNRPPEALDLLADAFGWEDES